MPDRPHTTPSTTEARVMLAITLGLFVALGVAPKSDRLTWFMENAPVLIALPPLLWFWPKFAWTRLTCWLLVVHGAILMIGGHWTYAEVPVGDWVAELAGFERNHYDRLGHFAQGFIPAILLREFLLRRSPLRSGGMLFFVVTFMCLGFSALYELIEWWAAVFTAEGAKAFLGTQGDVWDTQWDMFLCGIGAALSQLALRSLHDRQIGTG